MPLSNNLLLYEDCQSTLDQMIDRGGGRATLPSENAAIRFLQRCWKFRVLWNTHLANAYALGDAPENQYYRLSATRRGAIIEFYLDQISSVKLEFNEGSDLTSLDDVI